MYFQKINLKKCTKIIFDCFYKISNKKEIEIAVSIYGTTKCTSYEIKHKCYNNLIVLMSPLV